jgi:hypothetical protein
VNSSWILTLVAQLTRSAALLSCLLLAVFIPAGAQEGKRSTGRAAESYALIFGTVWNQNQQALAGVPIRVRPADEKKARWRLVSDSRGEFAQRVPPGKREYIVWADVKIPKGQDPPQVRVEIQNEERVDISLHLTSP